MSEAQFVMPHCCCRCLAEEPSESWTVKARMQVWYADGEDMTPTVKKYRAEVPLCKKCHGKLKRRGYLFWTLGLVVGVVFAFSGQHESDVDAGTQAMARLFLMVGIAWVFQWGCKQIFVNGLATYHPALLRFEFWNKRYQALFNEANQFMPDFAKRASRLGV